MLKKYFSGNKTNILVVDDHRLVRKAIVNFLQKEKEFTVIAEAGNGRECLDLLKTVKPDIVLLDIEMPVMSGGETLKLITRRYPDVKVVMLSVRTDENTISDYIAAGARAYVTKGSDELYLFKAIKEVQKEGRYFGEAVANALCKGLRNEKRISMVSGEMALSKREIEVLKELQNGKSNKEVAMALNISFRTVNFHRVNIYRKTKSHNLADLLRFSYKNAIIPLT